jgi:hypothetical protein
MKFPMITYGVLAIILLVAPLLVVTPVLVKIKKKALLEYSAVFQCQAKTRLEMLKEIDQKC